MKNYNRELFNDDWFEESKPQLLRAFDEFRPRSAYLSEDVTIEKKNVATLDETEKPNILSFPTSFCPDQLDGVNSFHDIFANNSKYDVIVDKLRYIERYVSRSIESAKVTFLTFSTNVQGAKMGVQHLHPKMNGDRCDVCTFGIPLYIKQGSEAPGFLYTSQEDMFPARWYVDYKRIKSQNYKYASFQLPLDEKILNLRFDGTRSPHYIDYKDHVYVWFVFDGVVYKDPADQPRGKQFIAELL